jgi:polar amino acid transport system substrate-binding protein
MKKIIFFLLFTILFMGSAYSAEKTQLKAFYSNFPPYEFKGKDGNPTGFSMELFKAIAKKAGIPITIEFYPWKRGMRNLEKNINSVIFTATRNESRENNYKWVGPITRRSINLYKLANSKYFDLDISTLNNEAALADILSKQYRIGAVSGDASEINLKKQGYYVYSSSIPETNVKQLFYGRFPILISLELSLAFKLRKMERKFSDVEKVAVFNDQYSYYFMFNKNVSCETVYRLQKALDIIKYNGVYKEIKKKWLK